MKKTLVDTVEDWCMCGFLIAATIMGVLAVVLLGVQIFKSAGFF